MRMVIDVLILIESPLCSYLPAQGGFFLLFKTFCGGEYHYLTLLKKYSNIQFILVYLLNV